MNNLLATCADWCTQVQSGMANSEDVLRALDFVKQLKTATKDIDAQMEQAVIGWIRANGDLTDGRVRYYVGPNKTTKCKDPRATLDAILQESGGDLDGILHCLASQPFKPATTKVLLGARAADFFVTTETADLKTGKPKGDRLQKHDPQFAGEQEGE